MSHSILVIVDGEKDEPRIIGKEECGFGLLPFMGVSDYEIVALGNPIYYVDAQL